MIVIVFLAALKKIKKIREVSLCFPYFPPYFPPLFSSIVTEKELLSKTGLKASEKEAILYAMKNHRRIKIDNVIALKYSKLKQLYPSLDREDILIAATAITKNLPLVTRNYKHYRKIKGLILFTGRK